MATIRERHTKTGEPRYTAMIRLAGTAKGYSRTFPTKRQADEWAFAQEAEIRDGKAPRRTKDTMADVLPDYMQYFRAKKKKSADATERELLRSPLLHYRLRSIRPAHVERVISGWTTKGGASGKPLLDASVRRMLGSLSAMFSWCVRKDYMAENPCHKVDRPSDSTARQRYLSTDEARKLLDAAKVIDERLAALIAVAAWSGCRRGELLKLRWKDVVIGTDSASAAMMLWDTKNGENRPVPVAGPAYLALVDRRRKTLDTAAAKLDGQRVFGMSYFPHPKWKRAVKLAGIADVRFHDLRHTAASFYIMSGESLEGTGQILGHKSHSMTKRYAHLSPEYKTESALRMAAKFNLSQTTA